VRNKQFVIPKQDHSKIGIRETIGLQGKQMTHTSIGIQVDRKQPHPHYRALQKEVISLKALIQDKDDNIREVEDRVKQELEKIISSRIETEKEVQKSKLES
jgi:hypothetical protein